jgi:RNA-directed DNA polymerase
MTDDSGDKLAWSSVMSATDTISYARADWHRVNWRQMMRCVRRLQVRIAEAIREGRRGKARALQRILTRSWCGCLVAVRRVTENQGKKTAGVDGVLWDTPQAKQEGVYSIQKGRYQPLALRRIYIPKKNKKKRPISIPAMKDRAKQALHFLALDPIAESLADRNSYGFRQGRSTADAIEQCFNVLARRKSPRWILEGDIASCFDKISHPWLVANIPMNKRILTQWLKAGYVERKTFHATGQGTPQGSIISPVLCNMTLDTLEEGLRRRFRNKKVNWIRYADDFIITGESLELLRDEVLVFVKAFLAQRGLSLSEEKTRITHIREGFDFLGQNVRKYGKEGEEKLIIKPAKQAVNNVLSKAKEILKENRSSTPVNIIRRLNPVLRGWANYHRHVCSKNVFSQIDWRVGGMILKWAKYRHPNKSIQWIKGKYFTSREGDNWVFFGKDEQGKEKDVFKIGKIPIQRHVKVQGNANPYDLAMERYFEQRLAKKWETGCHGKRKVLSLWQRQARKCPCCGQMISLEMGTHTHHIIYRVMGGPDTMDNLMLLHPECHRQLHANDNRDTTGPLRGAFERLEPLAGKLA